MKLKDLIEHLQSLPSIYAEDTVTEYDILNTEIDFDIMIDGKCISGDYNGDHEMWGQQFITLDLKESK